jgi:acyl-CoA synthetase (AMP-forming)/AMP-acid ligase II
LLSVRDRSQDRSTVGELLHSAASGGERLLFDVAGEQVTCTGALEGAGVMAGALAALGVQAGDRVATLLDNSLDAVHAVPSALGEDDLKVTAVLRAGVLSEEELVRWCLDKVPYFAVPRYVEFRAELPKNPVQRVLKYQLRAEGVTPSTWDRQSSGIVVQR